MDTEGGCLCGAVRYAIQGPVRRATVCHCTDCRRASGAPFLAWGLVRPERFVVTKGDPVVYRDPMEDLRRFCGTCGSQLTFETHRKGRPVLGFTIATLDDPDRVVPEDEIWTGSRLAWLPHVTQGAQHEGDRPLPGPPTGRT